MAKPIGADNTRNSGTPRELFGLAITRLRTEKGESQATVAAGVFRASITSWAGSGGSVALDRLVDQAFQALADGLPETTSLRHALTGGADRKDHH